VTPVVNYYVVGLEHRILLLSMCSFWLLSHRVEMSVVAFVLKPSPFSPYDAAGFI